MSRTTEPLTEISVLSEREAVSYLLQRKVISPAHIVTGDLVVADISRRHNNYKITVNQGPGFLLKQGVGQEKITAIAREAAVYRLLESKPRELNRYLPRLQSYDAEEHILVLEVVHGARNLREYHLQRGYFPVSLARALGNALGTLHRLTRTGNDGQEGNPQVATLPPWVLSVHRPTLNFLQECSSASIQLIETIQEFPEICDLFDGLRDQWRTDALTHRDVKWDNCLVFGRSPSARTSRLKIIDWEIASIGDPCWDVGSVFNDYLSFWLLSIPVTGEMPPDHFVELARYPLEKMQPALRAFWEAYVREKKLDIGASDRWLVRAVEYGAARLVQTAFEHTQMSIQLTGNIVCFLQLSLNMLRRPEEAAGRLLGIPLQGTGLP